MSDLSHLNGTALTIYLNEPTQVNGHNIAAVGGKCGGGWHPGPLVLNEIGVVLDVNGKDVTNETGLGGKTMMMNSRNIRLMVAS